MNARTTTIFALTLIANAGFVPGVIASDQPDQRLRCGVGYQHTPKVEVVFVLDTTGSMSGLIEGAKQKIWSIASSIAQAQPAPEIKMGLVGYRDRGDSYVTKRTALTDDVDSVYETLMGFSAGGGGDTPESVNQALFEAVERFDWSEDSSTLRIVFLVGDAPPQMGYEDDVKYQASCKLAAERGIIINTIQCGNLDGTRAHWNKISGLTNGVYASIAQDAGVQRITTAYDDEITALDRELASLVIGYGDRDERAAQEARKERAIKISSRSAPEASADRAMYNQSAAGRANLYGERDLVDSVFSGSVTIEEIKESELPAELQSKSVDELKTLVSENSKRRSEIESRLRELGKLRSEEQSRVRALQGTDGFDAQVLITLEKQGATIGLKFDSQSGSKEEGGKKKD